MSDLKTHLHNYLREARQALLWKLAGLSEYDARRPLTASGSNVLGIIKHAASVELGYLSDCFGRPSDIEAPWMGFDVEPNADMFATADQSCEFIIDFFRRGSAHADATIEALDLEAPGHVMWWEPSKADVTLGQILVHLIAEMHRHAGHVDILRETIDDMAGWRPTADLMWEPESGWSAYCARLQALAETFRADNA
ncbi:MAG: DinB family protein [Promicromonosporaceae bacterium]|nr:DinB family protein [Promicromonosporaceae bacterium]